MGIIINPYQVQAAVSADFDIDFLVVAGGGAGGNVGVSTFPGGGGGGGGVRAADR